MPSPETSRKNLENANALYRSPQPYRSEEECYVIRHLVWQWFRYRRRKWSARILARWTGVSHTFVLKLKREFTRDPAEMLRQERKWGFDVATFEQLREAREITRQMAERGELRPLRNSRGRELLGIPPNVPIWATVAYAFACLKNIQLPSRSLVPPTDSPLPGLPDVEESTAGTEAFGRGLSFMG